MFRIKDGPGSQSHSNLWLADLKNVDPAQELQATLWRKASNFLGALAHFLVALFFLSLRLCSTSTLSSQSSSYSPQGEPTQGTLIFDTILLVLSPLFPFISRHCFSRNQLLTGALSDTLALTKTSTHSFTMSESAGMDILSIGLSSETNLSPAWPLADQKLEQELLDLVQSSQRTFTRHRRSENQY